MNKFTISAVVAFALLFSGVSNATLFLRTSLSGAEEVPGPGDEDGSGNAVLLLKPGHKKVCYFLAVDDIKPATAAHVHKAPVGLAGPVVITLRAPDDTSYGCIEDVDRQLIIDIKDNPEQYYINVHNGEFPSGAVRGQLGDDSDD